MKNIVILGSTGSVGRQVLEVLRKNPGYYKVFGLAAKDEIFELALQIKEFEPEIISVATKKVKEKLEKKLSKINPPAGGLKTRARRRVEKRFISLTPKIYFGERGLIELARSPKTDCLVVSTAGTVALGAIFEAIKNKKKILIANKESLIIAGNLINKNLKLCRTKLLPLDSEHSAIFQCLKGEKKKEIKNIILTCSGGPFRNFSKEELKKVSVKDTISHPTWKMGPKISVDSATLMNKGFEVLEAHYLFGIPLEKIKVIIHPQCLIHSMVEFKDGTIKAQLSVPDMKIPIQYALFHPQRKNTFLPTLNLSRVKKLSFFEPKIKLFPCLGYAYFAGKIGGTMPAVLVFSDEIAVELFLKNKIKFLDIPKIIERVIKKHQPIFNPTLKEILATRNWVKKTVKKIL